MESLCTKTDVACSYGKKREYHRSLLKLLKYLDAFTAILCNVCIKPTFRFYCKTAYLVEDKIRESRR